MPAPPEAIERAVEMVESGRGLTEVCALMNISYRALCRARWPRKYRARDLCVLAVRNGDLRRPDACERCGEGDLAVQAHHHDYSRAFDVEWLCPACHGAEHVGDKRQPTRGLTGLEKKAIWAVAAAGQIDQADLLTFRSIDDVVDTYLGWVCMTREEGEEMFGGEARKLEPPPPGKKNNLTTGDIAARYGVAIGTVYQWFHEHGPPPHSKIGPAYCFRAEDVREWYAENRAA